MKCQWSVLSGDVLGDVLSGDVLSDYILGNGRMVRSVMQTLRHRRSSQPVAIRRLQQHTCDQMHGL
jgi:hypothetical protein